MFCLSSYPLMLWQFLTLLVWWWEGHPASKQSCSNNSQKFVLGTSLTWINSDKVSWITLGHHRTCGKVWWCSVYRPLRLGGEKKKKSKHPHENVMACRQLAAIKSPLHTCGDASSRRHPLCFLSAESYICYLNVANSILQVAVAGMRANNNTISNISPGISPGAAAPLELLPEIQYTVKRSCSSSQWI